MSSNHKAIIERWWAANNADEMLSLVDSTYAEGYVLNDPTTGLIGLQGLRDFITTVANAFPGARYTLQDAIAEGDRVAQRVRIEAVHRGEFFGIPATGRSVDLQIYVISRFEGGKIVEEWQLFDALTMLKQLGAMQDAATV